MRQNSDDAHTQLSVEEPSIDFQLQETDGRHLTIERAVIPDGGFVVIHDEKILRALKVIESVIDSSDYLEPGVYRNLQIELDTPISSSTPLTRGKQGLVAGLHEDTNNNRRFDFVSSEGRQDGPYEINGAPVANRATVINESGCLPQMVPGRRSNLR